MSQFYVFYPHGLQLVEQLILSLHAMKIIALPDPTLGDSEWKGLIILNSEGSMMPRWELHFKKVERLFAMNRDAPETTAYLQELNQGTLDLLREDKEAIQIIQHWERWNWMETAEVLKKECGLRLNGTAIREPLSDPQRTALDDYIQAVGPLMRKVREEVSADAADKFQQKLKDRIVADQKFFFTLTRLQA